jgi:hypothetical protein
MSPQDEERRKRIQSMTNATELEKRNQEAALAMSNAIASHFGKRAVTPSNAQRRQATLKPILALETQFDNNGSTNTPILSPVKNYLQAKINSMRGGE